LELIVSVFYRPDGSWDEFRQEEGESQGCPLSSFFSCLLLHRLLASLYTALADRARRRNTPDQPSYTMAFVDDTHAVSALSGVAFIYRFLHFHGPSLGLLLNCNKCSILLSNAGPAFFHTLPPLIQEELPPSVAVLDSPNRPPRPGLLPLGNIHHILARPLCTSFTPDLRVAAIFVSLTPTLTPPFFYMTTPPLLFLYSRQRTAASSLDTTGLVSPPAPQPSALSNLLFALHTSLLPSRVYPWALLPTAPLPDCFSLASNTNSAFHSFLPHYVVPAVTQLISMATIFSLVQGLRK
jgi:hypothetical protein